MASDTPSIQVNVTESSPVLRELRVEVEEARVRRGFDQAYKALGRQVRVRGFRPGKTPRSVLEKLYSAGIAEDLQRELIGATLAEALDRSGLAPVTEPAIEAEAPSPGAPFRYTARVEVKPEIELPDLAGLPAERPEVEVGEADVEAELERLRHREAPVLEEPEGSVVVADSILSIDFVGRIDDEPFPGGSGRGVELEMGSSGFPPGFEEGLLGARAGEDRELDISFPEEQGPAELRGKQARFHVHVVAIKRRHLPALDDEFAKDVGEEFDSLEQLRERIRSELRAARERAARETLQRSLVDSLIERTDFEVPPGLVESFRDRRIEHVRRRLAGQLGEEALQSQVAQWKEAWRGDAEREVRESLLLEAVAAQESLEVSDEEIELRVAEIAAEQGVDAARLRQAFGGGHSLDASLRSRLLEEKALDFLAARAKVETKTDT